MGILLTSPKPASHQNSLFQLVATIGNAGPLRQILMALFFCLSMGATIAPKATKTP